MRAEALARERHVLAEDAFVEIVVWRVPRPVEGSTHRLKYRLALIQLLDDFWADVDTWRRQG